eukprot:840916-Prorocentrum_lima.AAC.1
MAQAAKEAGQPEPEYRPLARPIEVGGVGTGTQVATHAVTHRIALPDGKIAAYEAPELPSDDMPALLGQKSLSRSRSVLDCFNNKLYQIGPGGYKMQLSP